MRVTMSGRWTEPGLDVFAPTRWALLNKTGSPTWAWHDPVVPVCLEGCTVFNEHMTDPASFKAVTINDSPYARALVKRSNSGFKNFWDYINADPKRQELFALCMEGIGKRRSLRARQT